MILYHYTTRESAEQIKDGRVIFASQPKMDGARGPGGRFGRGVYLTTIEPTNWLTTGPAKRDIAEANFGLGGEKNFRAGKVDYYIRLEMPRDHVLKVPGRDGVYVYPDDLSLREYPNYAIGKCHEWTGWNTALLAGIAVAAIGLGLAAGSNGEEGERRQQQHRQQGHLTQKQAWSCDACGQKQRVGNRYEATHRYNVSLCESCYYSNIRKDQRCLYKKYDEEEQCIIM